MEGMISYYITVASMTVLGYNISSLDHIFSLQLEKICLGTCLVQFLEVSKLVSSFCF